MSSETLLYERKDGIAFITLNRPKSFNSFNREMAFACQSALQEAAQDSEVRVVVIRGAGKAFCSGQDLVEVVSPELNLGFKAILEEHYNPIVMAITQMPKPVVAAVNGIAAGAGANLALCCDVVVAHEEARFFQAFSSIGLIPDTGGTYFLPRILGYQKALAIAMLGDKISATEAEKMGLIYAVYTSDTFEENVWQLAGKLAAMPTKGLALTKKAFQLGLSNSLEQQLMVESALQIEASETIDYQEGVRAFLEKRKPNFIGK